MFGGKNRISFYLCLWLVEANLWKVMWVLVYNGSYLQVALAFHAGSSVAGLRSQRIKRSSGSFSGVICNHNTFSLQGMNC
jgi:hypothetical protein